MCRIQRDGVAAFVGLPEREATKIADLWVRDEIGLELSVEVRAAVVVGIYPMRIARFVTDTYGHAPVNGHAPMNGHAPLVAGGTSSADRRASAEPVVTEEGAIERGGVSPPRP